MVRMAAVDLGAQSGRVAVGALEDGRLTLEEVHRFENTPVEERGALRWDVERLFEEATDGLRMAAREAPLASVAVDSWAVDFGLVDSAGQLLHRPVHYRDTRRADAVDECLLAHPAAGALRANGHPADADQHDLRAGRDDAGGRSGARPRPTGFCSSPTFFTTDSAGQGRASSQMRRRRSASTLVRATGPTTSWNASASRPACFRRSYRPRHRSDEPEKARR